MPQHAGYGKGKKVNSKARARAAMSKHPSQRTSTPIDPANRISNRMAENRDDGPVPVFFRKGVDDF